MRPYLLDLDEITRRVAEAEAEGATEVCLQGGIHPNFDGDYYVHVLGAVRAASERIHIHGFTALEVTEGARRSEVPLAEYLVRLKEAGLKTLPGTAAEILDDDIRAQICPDKINSEEWLEAHRTAHSVGLRSNITIMFGSVEHPDSWARHIVRTRALQRETGGFTEFVPLPFVHMATPIYLQRKARRGPTFRETLADALGGAYRLPGRHRQHPGELGEDGRRGCASGSPGRCQRRRGHADGREHLAGGRCVARAAHGRRGARDHGGPAGPARWCSARRCTPWREPHRHRERGRSPAGGNSEEGRAHEIADRLPDPQEETLHKAFEGLAAEHSLGPAQIRELQAMIGTLSDLTKEGTSVGDLKIAGAALAEMTEAFRVFRPYRKVRKMTMFGSARTRPEDPVYILARDLASQMAAADWMVVTGAGPGIMAAGLEGAGREHAFGVNIRLPHEEGANAFIAQDPKLVEMRYFFTRKLMLIKESHAYAILPGGFGTQDEAFELLTLLQTGKAEPAPVVMMETPGGTYWQGWLRFLEEEAIASGWVSPEDTALFKVATTVEEATDEILGFYRNYHSCRWVGRPAGVAGAHGPEPEGAGGAQPALRRHHHPGDHPHRLGFPARAFQQRPPRAAPPGAALRQVALRPAAPTDQRRQRVHGGLNMPATTTATTSSLRPLVTPTPWRTSGPLGPMAGVWEGTMGADTHPVAEGTAHDGYVEHYELHPIDFQTNGPQLFYGLRYHTHVLKPGEVPTFHDQVGYWLWEPAANAVTLTLGIPRGQALVAIGPAEPDATDFELTAVLGSQVNGIVSNPFLDQAFRTLRYRIHVTINDDGTWSYEEEGRCWPPDRTEPFPHTDRNTLHKVGPPMPNPLARAAAAPDTSLGIGSLRDTPDRYRVCSLPHFGHTVAYLPPLHLSHARQDSQWSWPLSISRYFRPGGNRTVMMTAATTPKMIQ